MEAVAFRDRDLVVPSPVFTADVRTGSRGLFECLVTEVSKEAFFLVTGGGEHDAF